MTHFCGIKIKGHGPAGIGPRSPDLESGASPKCFRPIASTKASDVNYLGPFLISYIARGMDGYKPYLILLI